MKPNLDMEKIAKGLGAERKGKVTAGGGFFGAVQLAADVQARFRVPEGGGRATDPSWTERRQVALTQGTLQRLEALTRSIRELAHLSIEPLQLAALLLERAAQQASEEEAEDLVRSHRSGLDPQAAGASRR
jgi:hypothetical protein